MASLASFLQRLQTRSTADLSIFFPLPHSPLPVSWLSSNSNSNIWKASDPARHSAIAHNSISHQNSPLNKCPARGLISATLKIGWPANAARSKVVQPCVPPMIVEPQRKRSQLLPDFWSRVFSIPHVKSKAIGNRDTVRGHIPLLPWPQIVVGASGEETVTVCQATSKITRRSQWRKLRHPTVNLAVACSLKYLKVE